MSITIAKTDRCIRYHVVRPISVVYATDTSEYVVMCGQSMADYSDVKEFDSYEDIPEDIEVCDTCLVVMGIKESPKIRDKQ